MKPDRIEVSRRCDVANIIMLVVAIICMLFTHFSALYTNHVADSSVAYYLTSIYYSKAFSMGLALCEIGLMGNLARYMRKGGEQLWWLLAGLIVVMAVIFVVDFIGISTGFTNVVRQVAGVANTLLLLALGILFMSRYKGRLYFMGVMSLVLVLAPIVIAVMSASVLKSIGWQALNVMIFLIYLVALFCLQRTMVSKKPETV